MRTKLHDPRLFWREENRFIQANVRGGDGKLERRSTKCVDEQAAVLWVNEQERASANPRYRDAAKATLFPAIEAAQRELQRRKRSAGTLSKFTQKAGHLLRLWGSDMTLARISAATVEDYIAAREREGVKPITVHAELQALRLILKVAAHHGLFEAKLEQVMPILYSSQHKPRTRWLSLDEMRALFDHVEEHHAAHLGFMAATGARRGESQRAERQDVDWDRGVVRIRGTKTEGAAAEIPITAITAELLAWSLACAPNKEGVLFRPWHNLNRDVAAACERAGIARCSPNDLRRTFAQWHRTKGIGAGDLAIMLRHTTSKLAETTYAKLSGENLGKLLEAKLGPVDERVRDANLLEGGRVRGGVVNGGWRVPKKHGEADTGRSAKGGEEDRREGRSHGGSSTRGRPGECLLFGGSGGPTSEGRLDEVSDRSASEGCSARVALPAEGVACDGRREARRAVPSSVPGDSSRYADRGVVSPHIGCEGAHSGHQKERSTEHEGPVLKSHITSATSATADTDDSLKTAKKIAPGLIRTGGLSFRKAEVIAPLELAGKRNADGCGLHVCRNCGATEKNRPSSFHLAEATDALLTLRAAAVARGAL